MAELKMLLITLIIGMAFRAMLSLSGVASRRMNVNALRLKDFELLKIVITALAVGMVGVNLLDTVETAHLKIKPAYLLGVVLDGACLA